MMHKPTTIERLTLEEMYEQYPDRWLLIADPELDEALNVIRGEVVLSSEDRDDIYNNLHLRNGKSAAIEYTGGLPEDIGLML